MVYDNKKQSKQMLPRGQSSAPTDKPTLSIRKVLCGIIDNELLKPGKTVTAEVKSQQLYRLLFDLIEKRENSYSKVFLHPPYSPDLAPSDYHLFRSIEHSLTNKSFSSEEKVREHLEAHFTSQTEDFFKIGFENSPK